MRCCWASPFTCLCQSGNDQSLLSATATDHEVFKELLNMSQPCLECHVMDDSGVAKQARMTRQGKVKGRPREMKKLALNKLRAQLMCHGAFEA